MRVSSTTSTSTSQPSSVGFTAVTPITALPVKSPITCIAVLAASSADTSGSSSHGSSTSPRSPAMTVDHLHCASTAEATADQPFRDLFRRLVRLLFGQFTRGDLVFEFFHLTTGLQAQLPLGLLQQNLGEG